jgi:hypothetical protein
MKHLVEDLCLVGKGFSVERQSFSAKQLCRFHELLWVDTVTHEVTMNGNPLRGEFSTKLQTLWRCGQSWMGSTVLLNRMMR